MKMFDRSIQEYSPLMKRAIELASLADGETSPNPLVGAVVLDGLGKIVGEGYHARAGQPHAEVGALAQAKNKADGGTLVVTLEPCCHQGKTPPCTDLILKAGIKRVVFGLEDPDPRVSGKGSSILREAGVEVIENILAKEIAFQNRAFIHRIKTGRPWGILKCAISLDGRIGLPNGKSKWITCEESRLRVHKLRSRCDAIVIGAGTLRKDNPLLTSRGISKPEPLRVVLTSSLNLPKDAQLWDTTKARTLVAYGPNAETSFLNKLHNGVERIRLSESKPKELLTELAQKGFNKVLWECGAELATIALKEDCVQELIFFISPKILGGVPAMTPFSNLGFDSMGQTIGFEKVSLEKIGKDFIFNMTV